MKIYKAHKNQTVTGAAVLSKTSASSVTGGTPGCSESSIDGEVHVGCCTDAVQQQ